MNDHPLTDEKIIEIWTSNPPTPSVPAVVMDAMRVAYDNGGDDMLGKVVLYMQEHSYMFGGTEAAARIEIAMRS